MVSFLLALALASVTDDDDYDFVDGDDVFSNFQIQSNPIRSPHSNSNANALNLHNNTGTKIPVVRLFSFVFRDS